MKKLIVTAFALTAAASVFAQGTVTFESYGSLGTTHYWGPSATDPYLSLQGNGSADSPVGATAYTGMTLIGSVGTSPQGAATTFAQLLYANGAAAPADSLAPGGQTTTFRTGATLGRISLITDTITGLTPDSAAATFAMVAWDNSSGNYPTWTAASAAWAAGLIAAGESTPFTVAAIGGSVNQPPLAISTGFNLYYIATIPEPTSFALAGLGAAALLIFRRRK